MTKRPGEGADPDAPAARLTIRQTEDGIGIHNSARRRIGLVVFGVLWLAGWAAGEYFALNEMMRSGSPLPIVLFLGFWLTIWTFAGLLVLSIVAWQLFGAETLFLVERGGVAIERSIGRFTMRRSYGYDRISDVGVSDDADTSAARGLFSRGAVRFTGDGRTRTFGIDLERREAERVVGLIQAFIDRHRGDDNANSAAHPAA